MIYVRTVLVSIASAVVLFILTKLMGNKQISQINMFDYVTGITIGSIAAEMAVTDEDIAVPLIAMAVYALLAVFISTATRLSVKCRKILSGRPLVLFDRGVVYKDNMKKARLDMSDFLTMCRVAGYHDLTEIETAVLEYTGALSVLPKSQVRRRRRPICRCRCRKSDMRPRWSWTGEFWKGTSQTRDIRARG